MLLSALLYNGYVSPLHMQSIFGIVALIGMGFIFSTHRARIAWFGILKMLLSAIVLCAVLMRAPHLTSLVEHIAGAFESLYAVATHGINFVFGNLTDTGQSWGFIFAIKVLPVIIFFSAFISLLNYLGIIRLFVQGFGSFLKPIFGTGAAETFCAVANSFLGQTEAPLLIREYLPLMSPSQIFAVMVAGMATISGSLIAVYSAVGISTKHLLISSLMSIPTSLLMAKLWHPEENGAIAHTEGRMLNATKAHNMLDAVSQGTGDGLMLALHIGAILIVIISLLQCVDNLLVWIFACIKPGSTPLTIGTIFGWLGKPAAWAIGIPETEITTAGGFIGSKVAVNEMIAYFQLSKAHLSERTHTILTYALCGFSNFSCIGIQIAGIGGMAPLKRPIISRLGLRAVFAAACVNLLNAAIVSLFL